MQRRKNDKFKFIPSIAITYYNSIEYIILINKARKILSILSNYKSFNKARNVFNETRPRKPIINLTIH